MELLSKADAAKELGVSLDTLNQVLARKGWNTVEDPQDRRRRGLPRDWLDDLKAEINRMLLERAQRQR